jgi:hypothetical protein
VFFYGFWGEKSAFLSEKRKKKHGITTRNSKLPQEIQSIFSGKKGGKSEKTIKIVTK